jgi:beta-mannosidase
MEHQAIKPVDWEYRLHADSRSQLDGFVDAKKRSALAEWTPCTQFPTEIHLELMRAGIIPHPYKKANEHQVQWVGKQSWEFRASIEVPPHSARRQIAELEFEGLDTFVKVYLNGMEMLNGDNHFLPYKVCWSRG